MTLSEHPLAWRWTDEGHSILPTAILSRMFPVTPEGAESFDLSSRRWASRDGLSDKWFASIACHSAKGSTAITRQWLLQQHQVSNETVIIAWDSQTALRTDWAVFVSYWDAFCYPSSDDIIVGPPNGDWACCYLHYEEFQFGAGLRPEPSPAGEPGIRPSYNPSREDRGA
jgi:hypothetical protein